MATEIKVTIEGLTPLLMNRFTEEAAIQVGDGASAVFGGDKDGTPREQAELCAYRQEDTGELFWPGPNIFSCLIESGKFQKVGRSKLTTQKSSLVPGMLQVADIIIPFGTKDFEVDSRRVVNPSTGGAHIKHRARLNDWRLTFTLDVETDLLSLKSARQLVDDGGRRCGTGDYRPSKKGPFGRFVVVNWDVKKAA